MAALSLRLLGAFEIRLASGTLLDIPGRKARALLGYLAARPDLTHPRAKLAGLLWSDVSDARARDSLRHTLAELRRALGKAAPALEAEAGDAVRLRDVVVDVPSFEAAAALGSIAGCERAAALYAGELLDGLTVNAPPFEEWLVVERERLRELALRVSSRLLAEHERRGATDHAIQAALRLLALDPLQEATHRALMRLYAAQGRRDVALRQYQRCVGMLQQELGTEPDAETRALYREILAERAAATSTRAAGSARRSRAPLARAPGTAAREDLPERVLVGRTQELVRLAQASRAAREGRGRVVAILGESGAGKTRLLDEVVAREWGDAQVLAGRAFESERVFPLGPWIDALRALAQGELEEVLGGLDGVWRAEVGRLVPELLPDGMAAAPGADPRRLLEGVTRLVQHLAVRRPVLIALEDLHWADETTLGLLAFLARRLAGSPVLVLVTARNDEMEPRGTLQLLLADLEREGHLSRLALGPLSRRETEALVGRLARSGTAKARLAGVAERIWEASRGNAFAIVETMRALAEGAPVQSAGGLPISEQVGRVVRARVERLGETAAQLLRLAAVIGRPFEFDLLERAAALPAGAAARGLEELVRRRLLEGVGDLFDLVHDHVGELVRADMLAPTRRAAHLAVAEALEATGGGDDPAQAGALGDHLLAGECWARAADYLRRAGRHAAAGGAHRAAVTRFEQARGALERLPAGAVPSGLALDLVLDLRNSLAPLGEDRRAIELLGRAEVDAAVAGDRPRLARIAAYMTLHHLLLRDPDRALESGERAITLAAELGDRRLHVVAGQYLGQACHALGDHRRAASVLREVLADLEHEAPDAGLGLPFSLPVFARAWAAMSLSELGEFEAALELGRAAVQLAGRVDRPWERAVAALALGTPLTARGAGPDAVAVLGPAVSWARSTEAPGWAAAIEASAAHAQVLAGRLGEGLAALEEVVSSPAGQRSLYYSSFLSALAEARLRSGSPGPAAAAAREALEVARARKMRGSEAQALRALAECEAADPGADPGAVEHRFVEALALADGLGMRPLAGRVRLSLGLFHRVGGRLDPAGTHLRAAADLFRTLGMQAWLERARAEIEGSSTREGAGRRPGE